MLISLIFYSLLPLRVEDQYLKKFFHSNFFLNVLEFTSGSSLWLFFTSSIF